MSAQTQPPDSLLADLPIPMNDDDSNDARTVAYLTPLSDDDVSSLLPALIPLLSNWRRSALHSHLLHRLAHASPTSALTTTLATILSAPDDPPSSTNPRTHAIALNHLIQSLPLRALPPYISALTHLSKLPSNPPSTADQWTAATATGVLRLAAGDVWAPVNKFDHLAIRSLHAGARSPAQMQPFVPDLLSWMQDHHWPVYASCAAQLARFPDVAAEGALHVLMVQAQGDDEWRRNVVNFVAEELPGEVREGCRGAVVEILEEVEGRVRVVRAEGEEEEEGEEADEWELGEACRECLEVMDWWVGREKVLGRVGWWWPKEELVDEDERW